MGRVYFMGIYYILSVILFVKIEMLWLINGHIIKDFNIYWLFLLIIITFIAFNPIKFTKLATYINKEDLYKQGVGVNSNTKFILLILIANFVTLVISINKVLS